MAIDDVNILDGIGIDEEENALILLLTDHLMWKSENVDALSEYDHLVLLQEKINSYISFLESEQYKEHYPNKEFSVAIIEIHFKYNITQKCESFLQTVQEQIGQYGILVKVNIEEK